MFGWASPLPSLLIHGVMQATLDSMAPSWCLSHGRKNFRIRLIVVLWDAALRSVDNSPQLGPGYCSPLTGSFGNADSERFMLLSWPIETDSGTHKYRY
jgi:hypothetical protein